MFLFGSEGAEQRLCSTAQNLSQRFGNADLGSSTGGAVVLNLHSNYPGFTVLATPVTLIGGGRGRMYAKVKHQLKQRHPNYNMWMNNVIVSSKQVATNAQIETGNHKPS